MEERMKKWFDVSSLPENIQSTGKIFDDAASSIIEKVAAGPERTVALRKLLESRDAAFRAAQRPGG